ncbi:hypothetical protein [Rubricoccus marinus]|uniref:Uncharacterized protein n=1 Tax=Rubricoccus marinus TaxID=716817 RepID=A0A259U1C6_9BACT|nr:hypothetical protein [Rubricoccus marinus]OZC03624.1 hypothetical protein BSZ36_11895 [Rubricoccus marinus]
MIGFLAQTPASGEAAELVPRLVGPLGQVAPVVGALAIVAVAVWVRRREGADRGLWRRRLLLSAVCMALCSLAFVARGVESVSRAGAISPSMMGPLLEGAVWWVGFAGVAALLVWHLLGDR